MVPNVGAANPEDDIGSDVGGVICNALKASRNHQPIHRLLRIHRLLLNHLQQIGLSAAVHAINFVVHLAHRVCKARIAFEQ